MTFLSNLARLMTDVARRAGAGIKAMITERAIPESVFGKTYGEGRHLKLPFQRESYRTVGGDGVLRVLPMGVGPIGPTRWTKLRPASLRCEGSGGGGGQHGRTALNDNWELNCWRCGLGTRSSKAGRLNAKMELHLIF